MAGQDTADHLDMSCPKGGKFYVCYQSSSRFIGCCQTDPCNDTGCPDGNLQPASFNASFVGNAPDQSCQAQGTSFYQCRQAKFVPGFWGCCKSNACVASSCPSGDLAGAYLQAQPALYSIYVPGGLPNSTSSATPSATSPSLVPTTTVANAHSGKLIGAVVGGTIGGLCFVLIAIVLGFCWCFRRRKSPKAESNVMNPTTSFSVSPPDTATLQGSPSGGTIAAAGKQRRAVSSLASSRPSFFHLGRGSQYLDPDQEIRRSAIADTSSPSFSELDGQSSMNLHSHTSVADMPVELPAEDTQHHFIQPSGLGVELPFRAMGHSQGQSRDTYVAYRPPQ